MEDSGPVSGNKARNTLRGNGKEFLHLKGTVEPAAQRLSFDVLHYDEELLALFEHVVHGRDMRIGELRGELRFMPKALPGALVGATSPPYALQGDTALEGDIVSAVDLAHAALPQPLPDDEPPHGRPGQVRGEPCGRVRLHTRLGHGICGPACQAPAPCTAA